MDLHDFYTGRTFDAHRFFGAHFEGDFVTFRTYAPGAQAVELIGEFNGWQGMPMAREGQGGVFSCRIQGAKPGMLYKYKIRPAAGGEADHCDPHGFWMELRPGSASALWPLGGYRFTDEAWMAARSRAFDAPVNIYEMHFGSWKKDEARENGWYRYDEIADKLIAHVKENGYNYIEFMPLSEHPADCSWGYQNTGFFAPTSRYGTPDQLKELIDKCHAAGIGVLLDFVPVHFALDAYALANYDGTALYEYPHSDVGVSEWGSCNFMHSRGEVCSFLQSAAHYWLEEFHFDGLRMDAISRMIYWQGDPARGVNGNAVSFLQTMNAGLRRLHPTAMLIAEDSTNFPKVTAPVEYGGLGFDYKWDLGWMNDTLDYFKKTPEERRAQYHKLTFSMAYFPQEHYLLPLSHDEVVHGKAAIVQKMYGDYEQKFPQARALYLYMMAHPGKKLNFMGSELGHMREWDEARELDWMLLQYPIHDAFRHFTEELNRLYLSNDAFWQSEYDPAHFQWLDCQADGTCLYAFLRRGGTHTVAAAFNFGDTPAPSYRLHMPFACRARVLLHTEWQRFGCGALAGRSRRPRADISGARVQRPCAGTGCAGRQPHDGQTESMTETKHTGLFPSAPCVLFFYSPRAAARPAAIPVAQAHCRLKPPQSPAASSTSPERYRPGHLREAQPSVFTSASGTPPPVTCACVQGSVPSTAKRQFLSALARAFTSLRERLPGARESGCRPQLFSIACPSFLATSPSRSVSSEANMPDAQRCSSIPRRTGNAISGKKSTLVPAFFTPGPSRHESCMAGIPERPYSANCTSPRSVPAHRPSRYSESAQLARTPFNPTGNPAHRSGTRHGYGSATLWPSMRAKAKAEPSVPNCGPA